MPNWLKKLLGLQPSPTAQPELPLTPVTTSLYRTDPETVEELDAENIVLGRMADQLRQQRLDNRRRAAVLRDGSH